VGIAGDPSWRPLKTGLIAINFVSKSLDESETTLRLEEGTEMEQGCEIHAPADGEDGVSQGNLRNDEIALEDL